MPARVLNLVVVADREWRGEIQNRLDQVGRYHASRTILCSVESRQTTIDAFATAEGERASSPDDVSVLHEQVVLDLGPKHLEHLETIVDPLVVTDLPTLVWSPHGHPEAVDALLELAQVVLIDSVNEPDPAGAVRRAQKLSESALRRGSRMAALHPLARAGGIRLRPSRSGAASCGRSAR